MLAFRCFVSQSLFALDMLFKQIWSCVGYVGLLNVHGLIIYFFPISLSNQLKFLSRIISFSSSAFSFKQLIFFSSSLFSLFLNSLLLFFSSLTTLFRFLRSFVLSSTSEISITIL